MKRFLKIVTILAAFTLVIAYVVFRVVFFDPFGGARSTLDSLVPRDVDVMVRRRELAKDFEPFPTPRFFLSLQLKDEWEALTRTRWFNAAAPKLQVERAFDELERLPEQMRPLDLMKDLAGREVLFAGRFRPDGTLAYAAIARGSFRAKFGVEAMKFGLARKIAGDAIQGYEEKDGVRSVVVQGQRWHLARIDDAVIAGNDFELVQDIVELEGGKGQSIDDSPQYREAILTPSPVGRPIDFVADVADLGKHAGLRWPPAKPDEPALLRFARELLLPERFGQAMGRIALGGEIEFSTVLNVDRAAMQPLAGGLFEGTTASLQELHQFCGRVFPQKVAICGDVRLDVREFLRRVESLLDPDVRQLLNDFVANLKSSDQQFAYKSTIELLDAFSGVVADELMFAIEPDEAYKVPGTAEGEMQFPDPRWGPRIALVFPVGDKEQATQFVDRLIKALSTRQSAISHVWAWNYPDGTKFREVKTVDPDTPTISIGVLTLQKRDCVVITTTGAFLDEIVAQKLRADRGENSGLQAVLQYKQAQEAMSGFGQGFVFLSSPNLRKVLSEYAVVMAEEATRPDWVTIRREVERQVLAKKHPQLVGRNLDEPTRREIEPEVDAEITKREKDWRDVVVPKKTEELRADLEGLDMLRWFVATLRVADRQFELKVRLATPANFADY